MPRAMGAVFLGLAAALAGPSVAGGGPAVPTAGGASAFRALELTLGDRTFRYAVYVPAGYDSTRAWPCIVFLHGSGECGEDGVKPTLIGLGPALLAHPERWPFVVVFPQKPREDEEWEEHEDLVLAALDSVRREFRVDSARIALTGNSQGGHGAWVIGARHAELWSCLAPVCGYGRALTVATRVARLPVWAFHGMKDDQVDPQDTRKIVEAIRGERARLGLDPQAARITLYPDANHDSWDPAYAEEELPRWMLAQRREEPR
jgi:predicted peptidase